MSYEIKQEEKRTVAGFHLVGPWEQTVKKGFEQLMMWVDSKNIVPKECSFAAFIRRRLPSTLQRVKISSLCPRTCPAQWTTALAPATSSLSE